MGTIERKELIKSMRERTKKATSSKEAAISYLKELGVLTKTGKYTKSYRDSLCINSKAA